MPGNSFRLAGRLKIRGFGYQGYDGTYYPGYPPAG